MDENFKIAEEIIKNVKNDLSVLVNKNTETINCYNPTILDKYIHKLIKARDYMALGRILERKGEKNEINKNAQH